MGSQASLIVVIGFYLKDFKGRNSLWLLSPNCISGSDFSKFLGLRGWTKSKLCQSGNQIEMPVFCKYYVSMLKSECRNPYIVCWNGCARNFQIIKY